MMLLRSKRRLSQASGPRRKRLKTEKEDREPLFINNAIQSELVKLRKVGPANAEKIMEERQRGLFRSESDLISRLSFITKISIADSPVRIVFETEYQLECNKICGALLSIKYLKEYPNDIVVLIADFAIGQTVSCDNPNCDGDVVISKEHRLRWGLLQQGHDYEYGIKGLMHTGYVDSLPNKKYVMIAGTTNILNS